MYEPESASPWKFLSDYATWGVLGHRVIVFIAITVAAAPLYTGAWAAFTWALQRRDDRKNKEFETYHRLIKELVESEDEKKPLRLDRQIAVIFELRRFKFYQPVTKRILAGLRKNWAAQDPRILKEIDVAIQAIGETRS